MIKNRLGSSDIIASEISLGCMSLDVQSNESVILLKKAFDAGINFFDTADLYDRGENEKIVGQALKPVRDQIIIATKVGNQWRKDGSGWNWNPTKEYILKAVEDSLIRLQTDYIDLYQLHGGTIDDPIDETIEAFEILKQQGKIREYGISSIRPNVIREWVKRSNITSVMMQYSLLDRRPEEEMLDLLHQKNISVLTRGTLAKGLLIGKPAKGYLGYSETEVHEMQKALANTGNPLSFAIQFVLNNPTVTSSVIGIRTIEQLDSIIRLDSSSINSSYLEAFKPRLQINHYQNHR